MNRCVTGVHPYKMTPRFERFGSRGSNFLYNPSFQWNGIIQARRFFGQLNTVNDEAFEVSCRESNQLNKRSLLFGAEVVSLYPTQALDIYFFLIERHYFWLKSYTKLYGVIQYVPTWQYKYLNF